MEEKIKKLEERISNFLIKFPIIARLLHYDLDGTKETNRSKKEKVNLEGMSELSKTIFNGYQRRRTRKQKDRFIELIQSKLDKYGDIKVKQEEKHRNIVIGNVETAKIIITAHYDTPMQLRSKRILFPHNPFRSWLSRWFIPSVWAILTLGLCIYSFLIMKMIWLGFELLLFMIVLIIPLSIGVTPNSYNYNDNTSGIITVVELVLSLSKKEMETVAFVLFDNEERKCLGSEHFIINYPNNYFDEKLLINFDCVADGKHFIFSINEKVDIPQQTIEKAFGGKQCNLKNANGLSAEFPNCIAKKAASDHKHFPNSIGVGAFHQSKRGIYYLSRIHTKSDTHFDMENIHYLVEGTKRLLKELP